MTAEGRQNLQIQRTPCAAPSGASWHTDQTQGNRGHSCASTSETGHYWAPLGNQWHLHHILQPCPCGSRLHKLTCNLSARGGEPVFEGLPTFHVPNSISGHLPEG